MGRLSQYFFDILPDYFYLYDTYKDGLGKGVLQRYMEVFQSDAELIDEQIKQITSPTIILPGLAGLPFPLTTEEKYLSFIASLYGNPPDTFQDTDWYQQILRNIIDINKVKGNPDGFYRYWGCMGVAEAEIYMLTEFSPVVRYDDGVSNYDDGTSYYDSTCFPCAYFTISIGLSVAPITFVPLEGTISDNTKRNIQSILAYLFPINTILRDFQYNQVSVDIDLGVDNLIIIE